MPGVDTRILSTRISNQTADRFEEIAQRRSMTSSKLLNELVTSFLSGKSVLEALRENGYPKDLAEGIVERLIEQIDPYKEEDWL